MIGNILEKNFFGYAGLTGIARQINVEKIFEKVK